mgnify:CR=1 FL=1
MTTQNKFFEILVSSQRIRSEFFNTFRALNVISSKLPIGVETMYKPGKKLFINYEKKIYYIFILFIDYF